MVLKCLSSGAVDFWVRPLRPNEVHMLWTRVWRQQVRARAWRRRQGALSGTNHHLSATQRAGMLRVALARLGLRGRHGRPPMDVCRPRLPAPHCGGLARCPRARPLKPSPPLLAAGAGTEPMQGRLRQRQQHGCSSHVSSRRPWSCCSTRSPLLARSLLLARPCPALWLHAARAARALTSVPASLCSLLEETEPTSKEGSAPDGSGSGGRMQGQQHTNGVARLLSCGARHRPGTRLLPALCGGLGAAPPLERMRCAASRVQAPAAAAVWMMLARPMAMETAAAATWPRPAATPAAAATMALAAPATVGGGGWLAAGLVLAAAVCSRGLLAAASP